MCLWVGAVLFQVLRQRMFILKEKIKRFSKREQFSARMFTFIVMGIGQALIVTLGNYFALGVDVRNPAYSVWFAVLIAITFMIMVYVLVALWQCRERNCDNNLGTVHLWWGELPNSSLR